MSSATEQARGGLAAWQLRRVADYVDKHLTSPLRVETLAQVVRLSPGHFCRAFKEHMGETPHGFIMRRRVRRAQILILTTVDSLSQIAHACGLSDQSHLTRLFRRYVGETPMAWRRKWQRSTQDDDFSCPLRPDGDRSFS
jgi:AraC-like DNA-binding protein